jgi:hypothetical protein
MNTQGYLKKQLLGCLRIFVSSVGEIMDVKTETTVFIDVAEDPSEIVVSDGDTLSR